MTPAEKKARSRKYAGVAAAGGGGAAFFVAFLIFRIGVRGCIAAANNRDRSEIPEPLPPAVGVHVAGVHAPAETNATLSLPAVALHRRT
jgi:hypothetical protein